MSEEIDKHVLKKYEVQQRLGKGVSALAHVCCGMLLSIGHVMLYMFHTICMVCGSP